MLNALTVDVEDYFQVTAFERHVRRDQWDQYPLRVNDNTLRVLDLFDEYGVKATFFILGWVAKRVPNIVYRIAERGHEIACHGYGHELVYAIGPDRFRKDIVRSKSLLEDLCGVPVIGYRAPSYSITRQSLWALDILVEEGFSYDSSIFPIVHDIYGVPGAERFPHVRHTEAGPIREFPLTTLPIGLPGKQYRLPIAGGGYLRLLPWWLLQKGIQRINEVEGMPSVLYFHPWEIDPDQPRIKGAGLKSRFRHYINLHRTASKLRHLLSSLHFASMAHVLENESIVKEPADNASRLKLHCDTN